MQRVAIWRVLGWLALFVIISVYCILDVKELRKSVRRMHGADRRILLSSSPAGALMLLQSEESYVIEVTHG